MGPFVLRCLNAAAVIAVVWAATSAGPVLAADQGVIPGEPVIRYRAAGPTPHIRVVCYDVAGRKINCADSARVSLQLAHYPCYGCAPVALPPSRYSAYWGW